MINSDAYRVQSKIADQFIHKKLLEYGEYYLWFTLRLGLYDENTNSMFYLYLLQVICFCLFLKIKYI